MLLKEFISKKVSDYLNEATVENDKYYYDIAVDFYEKMIEELQRDNYITQPDGNIVFKAWEANLNFRDLLILFIDEDRELAKPSFAEGGFKGSYAFATFNQYKVIVVPNLRKDNRTFYERIRKDGFIHEFIHYLDYRRSVGRNKPKYSDKSTLSDYFNSPTEYNAYYQEAATFVVNLFDNPDILKSFKEKYAKFEDFYDWMVENVFREEFIKYLNDKNKIKLKKRIYNIYYYFMQK